MKHCMIVFFKSTRGFSHVFVSIQNLLLKSLWNYLEMDQELYHVPPKSGVVIFVKSRERSNLCSVYIQKSTEGRQMTLADLGVVFVFLFLPFPKYVRAFKKQWSPDPCHSQYGYSSSDVRWGWEPAYQYHVYISQSLTNGGWFFHFKNKKTTSPCRQPCASKKAWNIRKVYSVSICQNRGKCLRCLFAFKKRLCKPTWLFLGILRVSAKTYTWNASSQMLIKKSKCSGLLSSPF